MISKAMTLLAASAATAGVAAQGGKTIRMVYPQWQGAKIEHWIPEIADPAVSARGYYLGARLLNFIAPRTDNKTVEVPVSTDFGERVATDGVLDRDVIAAQTRAALDILDVENPDKVVVLGGECSVSVAPFTWLASKYGGDVAVVWIDAHPDITLPGDVYEGYHAMAVTVCIGLGDSKIVGQMPHKFEPGRILLVGLRDWERDEIRKRQGELGVAHLAPADVAQDSRKVLEWLDACGASRVAVHFDMDVLDPAEIIPAVGVSPGGMKIAEVVRVIGDIARAKDLVGLTVAEPMPRIALRLREMLERLPLMK